MSLPLPSGRALFTVFSINSTQKGTRYQWLSFGCLLNACKWSVQYSDSSSSRLDEQWFLENSLLDSSWHSQLAIAVKMPTMPSSNQSSPEPLAPLGNSSQSCRLRCSSASPVRTALPPRNPLNILNIFPVSNMHLLSDDTFLSSLPQRQAVESATWQQMWPLGQLFSAVTGCLSLSSVLIHHQ